MAKFFEGEHVWVFMGRWRNGDVTTGEVWEPWNLCEAVVTTPTYDGKVGVAVLVRSMSMRLREEVLWVSDRVRELEECPLMIFGENVLLASRDPNWVFHTREQALAALAEGQEEQS